MFRNIMVIFIISTRNFYLVLEDNILPSIEAGMRISFGILKTLILMDCRHYRYTNSVEHVKGNFYRSLHWF